MHTLCSSLSAVTAFLLVSTTFGVEQVLWIPPAKDLVGTGAVPIASGINDWHIRVRSDRLGGLQPAAWRIQGGLWYSMVDVGRWYAPFDKGWLWDSIIDVHRAGNTVDLYFEPLLAWPGDIFTVTAVLGVDKTIEWLLVCNGEGWQTDGAWLGQGVSDTLGWKSQEPDGIRDWELVLREPPQGALPARIEVWLPYDPVGGRTARRNCFDYWGTPGRPGTMPARAEQRGDGLHVFVNPVLATGGDEFYVRAVWPDKSWNVWKIIGMGSEWEAGGSWFGQDDDDFVGMYDSHQGNGVRDWHLQVSSSRLAAPVRWFVRGAGAVWEDAAPGLKLASTAHYALQAQLSGPRADLYFDPAMERAGDVFYVSAVLADGTMLNWGVTSVRQLRSQDVKWHGQDPQAPVMVAGASSTNMVNQWLVVAKHDKMLSDQPYLWRVKDAKTTWQEPRETEKDIADTRALQVELSPGTAKLHFLPVWAKPGEPFNVQALFTDGTLVQWTALADGAEWARAAEWIEGAGADYVGHTPDGRPDDKPDWALRISDPALREPLALLEVTGEGWRWAWPQPGSASPAHVDLAGETAAIYIAPVPGKGAPKGALTVRALTTYGTVRYWQAIAPMP
jgi:hypothetical protein